MRILTLNTHSWREKDGEVKINRLANVIKEKDYDIIALQEVNQLVSTQGINIDYLPTENEKETFKSGRFIKNSIIRENNYIEVLLKKIKEINGPEYYYVWDKAKLLGSIYEEGCAILSKKPFKETESFRVSATNNLTEPVRRTIVRATIEYKEELIDIYSCHLGWWHDQEEPVKPQIDILMKKVNSNRLSFLIGDFNNNANIRDEGYDYLMSYGLVDSYAIAKEKDSGVTVQGEITGWSGNKLDLRIDLILMNKALDIKKSQIIFNGKNQEVISDHYGVEIEL